MILTIDKTHELKGNGYLLGVDGENGSEQLIIKVENEALLDKWVYIEFEKDNGEKFTTERLSVVGGQIVYDIPNGLLPQGHVKVQVIFRDADGFVWKSFVRQFAVDKSLNASDNLPIEYPDFIGEAQKLLDEINIQADKVDGVLESEEARKTAETARETAETERTEKETARQTAEQERAKAEATRQTNEASRVNAEQTRTAQFSAWSNYEGDAPEILANLEAVAEGKLFDSVTDKTTAHTKATPSGSLPYARLSKVGGKSYKSKNLFNAFAEQTDTRFGVATVENNGSKITVNGPYYAYMVCEMEAGETYKVYFSVASYTEIKGIRLAYEDGTLSDMYTSSFTVKPSQNIKVIYLYSGSGKNGTTVYENLVVSQDLTLTEFEPYFNGLRDAKVKSINNLLIPSEVQALEGYGQGNPSDASKFNYIDFDKKEFVACGKVEDGAWIDFENITTTDISQYINKSYIPANGSVVFENDNGEAVPSEITFFVKK